MTHEPVATLAVAGGLPGLLSRQLMIGAPGLHVHLRAWRDAKGLSQEQVANTLAVNKSTIHRWETGARTVDLADLERLAELYGVDPIALLMAPGDVQLAHDLSNAKGILTSRDPDATRTWLEMGNKLPALKPE